MRTSCVVANGTSNAWRSHSGQNLRGFPGRLGFRGEQRQGDFAEDPVLTTHSHSGTTRSRAGGTAGRAKSCASRAASSRSSGSGHCRPAAAARCKYPVTVPSPMAHARAIARWLRPASYFRRSSSRSRLISSLVAAIQDLLSGEKIPGSLRYRRAFSLTGTGVHDHRNPCSPWPESAFMMTGIGVQHRSESVFTFDRNGCSRWAGIRTRGEADQL